MGLAGPPLGGGTTGTSIGIETVPLQMDQSGVFQMTTNPYEIYLGGTNKMNLGMSTQQEQSSTPEQLQMQASLAKREKAKLEKAAKATDLNSLSSDFRM